VEIIWVTPCPGNRKAKPLGKKEEKAEGQVLR